MQHLAAALADRYRVERELGAGGMATVYLAHDIKHDRKVAIKVLRQDIAASVGAERFLREIRLAAQLQHPHILGLLDSGQVDGQLYYVMPFVEGDSLRERLARSGAFASEDAARITREVADALAYAHQRGVIHRDIKPENIMLSGRHALVMDFGVARAVSEATGRSQLTTMGVAIGTPAYMAPEQIAADPNADQRIDLYALGLVAYEMLSGKGPFAGVTPQQMLAAHVTQAPADVRTHRPDAPPAFAELVMRCLAKNPDDRPPADFMVRALEGVTTSGERIVSGTPPSHRRAQRVMTLGALLLLITLAGAWWANHSRTTPPTGAAQSIAVLPFENVGGDTAVAYVADGLADGLRGAMLDAGVRVAPQVSSESFRGKPLNLQEASTTLHVANILTGQVRHLGTRLSVSVELDSAGSAIWHQTVERDSPDAPVAQATLLADLTAALRARLRLVTGRTARHVPDATTYDLYMRGVFLRTTGTEANLKQAITYFNRAIARDTAFAMPWVQLAYVYGNLADAYAPPREVIPQALAAGNRAIALDDSLSAAYTIRATLTNQYTLDWSSVESDFAKALSLDPNDADAHFWRSMYFVSTGRHDAAIADLQVALRLDPLSSLNNHWAILLYSALGLPDSAIAQFHRAQTVDSAFFYIAPWEADAYRRKGDYPSALAIEKASSVAHHGGKPTFGLVVTLANMGRMDEARRDLAELELESAKGYFVPEFLAYAEVVVGNKSKAIELLEQGVRDMSAAVQCITWWPEFRTLLGDPRFEAHLVRTGLKKYMQ